MLLSSRLFPRLSLWPSKYNKPDDLFKEVDILLILLFELFKKEIRIANGTVLTDTYNVIIFMFRRNTFILLIKLVLYLGLLAKGSLQN